MSSAVDRQAILDQYLGYGYDRDAAAFAADMRVAIYGELIIVDGFFYLPPMSPDEYRRIGRSGIRSAAVDLIRKQWSRSPQYRRLRAEAAAGLHACAVCGIRESITIEHVVPLVLGGRHDPDNLAWLCGPHNSAKGWHG